MVAVNVCYFLHYYLVTSYIDGCNHILTPKQYQVSFQNWTAENDGTGLSTWAIQFRFALKLETLLFIISLSTGEKFITNVKLPDFLCIIYH